VADRLMLFRRLMWVGPATVAVSVVAVEVVQQASLLVLPPLPQFSDSVLRSNEPAALTAVLVAAAVVTFAILGRVSDSPVAAFRRLAFGVLILSFVPNIVVAWVVPEAGWVGMLALMALHVVAWAVTTVTLTRFAVQGSQR
jgi:hypothetical protein